MTYRLLLDGRAEAARLPHACPQPRCTQETLAYEVPGPKCPLHGVPMKRVRKAARRPR